MLQGNKNQSLCVKTSVNYYPNYWHKQYFTRWTRQKIQNLSSKSASKANGVPTEEPFSNGCFYKLITFSVGVLPEVLRAYVYVFYFCMSVFQDGVIFTSHFHLMLWDIICAAGFKLFPATTIAFCTPKTWKEALWWYSCCSLHEAKAEPNMVVSTPLFRLVGGFGFEERKGRRMWTWKKVCSQILITYL